MKIIDVHSLRTNGHPLPTCRPGTARSPVRGGHRWKAKMAQTARDSGVQTILDFGFSEISAAGGNARALHDYAFKVERPPICDVILGH